VRLAVDLGVNYFDTAPGYGNGRSEATLGEALSGVRERVVLATKYPFDDRWRPDDATTGMKASLTRLRTDYLDLLQLHGGTFTDAQADSILASGVLDWSESMRAAGFCRFTGITAEGPSGALERLLQTGRFDVIEIQYNVLYQAVCDHQRKPAGIAVLAKSLGMGVTAMRPATSGLLQRIMRSGFPELDSRELTRLAINYVLSTPEIDCAVVGMCSIADVRENAVLASDTTVRFDLRALHERYVSDTPENTR
jgi:aryl-alcohol dehydrogenase-like predicted oxidoreductase